MKISLIKDIKEKKQLGVNYIMGNVKYSLIKIIRKLNYQINDYRLYYF